MCKLHGEVIGVFDTDRVGGDPNYSLDRIGGDPNYSTGDSYANFLPNESLPNLTDSVTSTVNLRQSLSRVNSPPFSNVEKELPLVTLDEDDDSDEDDEARLERLKMEREGEERRRLTEQSFQPAPNPTTSNGVPNANSLNFSNQASTVNALQSLLAGFIGDSNGFSGGAPPVTGESYSPIPPGGHPLGPSNGVLLGGNPMMGPPPTTSNSAAVNAFPLQLFAQLGELLQQAQAAQNVSSHPEPHGGMNHPPPTVPHYGGAPGSHHPIPNQPIASSSPIPQSGNHPPPRNMPPPNLGNPPMVPPSGLHSMGGNHPQGVPGHPSAALHHPASSGSGIHPHQQAPVAPLHPGSMHGAHQGAPLHSHHQGAGGSSHIPSLGAGTHHQGPPGSSSVPHQGPPGSHHQGGAGSHHQGNLHQGPGSHQGGGGPHQGPGSHHQGGSGSHQGGPNQYNPVAPSHNQGPAVHHQGPPGHHQSAPMHPGSHQGPPPRMGGNMHDTHQGNMHHPGNMNMPNNYSQGAPHNDGRSMNRGPPHGGNMPPPNANPMGGPSHHQPPNAHHYDDRQPNRDNGDFSGGDGEQPPLRGEFFFQFYSILLFFRKFNFFFQFYVPLCILVIWLVELPKKLSDQTFYLLVKFSQLK